MSPSARDRLLELLLSTYPDLKRQMTRRLGSSDLAVEALHDAFLRLHRSEALGEVQNLKSYLYRMVLNTGKNLVRAEARRTATFRATMTVDIPDDTINPQRIAEARSELAAVERALQELPPRRLAIFRRAWLEGVPYDAIAEEFGIAERTVRYELQQIARHLHAAVKEKSLGDLQFRLAQVSSDGEGGER